MFISRVMVPFPCEEYVQLLYLLLLDKQTGFIHTISHPVWFRMYFEELYQQQQATLAVQTWLKVVTGSGTANSIVFFLHN